MKTPALSSSAATRSLCLLAVPALALALGGCTSGEVVNSSYAAYPLGQGGQVTFYPVTLDSTLNYGTAKWSASNFIRTTVGSQSTFFSFDPNAATNTNAANGIDNQSTVIPIGYYFASIRTASGATFNSPIFHHDYYTTANDDFTGKSTQWAPYYLKVSTCTTWLCYNTEDGANSWGPPTDLHDNYRVIPFLTDAVLRPEAGNSGMITSW